MKLPREDARIAVQRNAILEREDLLNQKTNRDIEVGDRDIIFSDTAGVRWTFDAQAGGFFQLNEVDGSGSFQVGSDFYYQVAAGNVSGVSSVNKFGRNPDIDTATDPEDVWDAGGVWVAPTTARTHDIASTDVNDDGDPGGTGARTIRVYGLTAWDTAETSEDITLNGTTNVPTANTYVIIHRMKCLTFGSGATNAGDITATAQTDATVTAQISAGEGQTLMAIYGVPSTLTAYVTRWYMNANRALTSGSSADIELLVNERADQSDSGFLVKHHLGLATLGTSHASHEFAPYVPFAGPCIIKVSVENVSANNTDISAGFDLLLA